MTPITLNDLTQYLRAERVDSSEQQGNNLVDGVSIDNRSIRPGDAFVAFEGARVDGHTFVEDSLRRGASVAIVTKPVKTNSGPVLKVDDALAAIQNLAKRERSLFSGPVVGITGSNGKTTTKQMVKTVLTAMGECLYTASNRNNELGLPLTILQRMPVHRSIVLEMGMRGFGQIRDLCEIASPTIGIITNIGQSHIELLGSQEGIARAKGELLESLPATGYAVLNGDDEWLRRISDRSATKAENIVWYGLQDSSDVRATNIQSAASGMHFEVDAFGDKESFFLPTYGRHNVSNALAATAVGLLNGVSLSDIRDKLAGLEEISGRLSLISGKEGRTVIDDCYNASPLSMKASLEVLSQLTPPDKRVAILGDMYELGDYTEDGHREVGVFAAKAQVSHVIAVGKHAHVLCEAAKTAGVPKVYYAPTVSDAIRVLDTFVPRESTVLVKASRGMELEQIVKALVN